jgi:hypothetical protein
VGGTRERRFDGIQLGTTKTPKNAPTPTSRVHAVLGALTERQSCYLIINIESSLAYFTDSS